MSSLKPYRVFVLTPLLIVVLGADLPYGATDYLHAAAPQLASVAAERHDHRDPCLAAPVPANHAGIPTAAFAYSFIKFDRQQNTRLWPFVTEGITRSPPNLA